MDSARKPAKSEVYEVKDTVLSGHRSQRRTYIDEATRYRRNDRDELQSCRELVGEYRPVSSGYLPYWIVFYNRPNDSDFINRWAFLLKESPATGHVPSIIEYWERRLPKLGFFQR